MAIYEMTCIELGVDTSYSLEEEILTIHQVGNAILEFNIVDTLKRFWQKIVEMFQNFWNWITGKRNEQEDQRKKARETLDEALKKSKERMRAFEEELRKRREESSERFSKVKAAMDAVAERHSKLAPVETVNYQAVFKMHEAFVRAVEHTSLRGTGHRLATSIDLMHKEIGAFSSGLNHFPNKSFNPVAAREESSKNSAVMKAAWDKMSAKIAQDIAYVEEKGGGHTTEMQEILSKVNTIHNSLLRQVLKANIQFCNAAISNDLDTAKRVTKITEHMSADEFDKTMKSGDDVELVFE